ncbi:MAG: hypothetical protein HY561_04780 [Gemmatimonadetes bacterium]|nr:hypothetical protein [Gemmatimonadota bacterium]
MDWSRSSRPRLRTARRARLRLRGVAWTALAIAPLVGVSIPSTGTIEGRLVLSERPARRVAAGYAGAGASAHAVPSIPSVVYLVGPVAAAAPRRVASARLAQRDTAFDPPLLVIPVGTTVAFPNQDPFFHNVFSYSRVKRFDLGRYPRGESKAVTFDEAGVVRVFCEVHKWMRSAIVVVENPFFAVPDADGAFSIPDVPEGRYRLAVWTADRGERTVDVRVPAGGRARVEIQL